MECKVEIGADKLNLCFRVSGYATYVDAIQVSKFLNVILNNNNFDLVTFDLSSCEKMDSTFMGIIASLACENEDGNGLNVQVAKCSPTSLQCLEDLGLTKLVTLVDEWNDEDMVFLALKNIEYGSKEQHEIIYLSHKALSAINECNREKFSAVIDALNVENH